MRVEIPRFQSFRGIDHSISANPLVIVKSIFKLTMVRRYNITFTSSHLFVLPTTIKKNPCKPNPMYSLFSSLARILPTLQTKSFQPYFCSLPISKNFISLWKSLLMAKPVAGNRSRSCPVLNLPMDCKDQGLRLVFLFLLVRVRVLFFFFTLS